MKRIIVVDINIFSIFVLLSGFLILLSCKDKNNDVLIKAPVKVKETKILNKNEKEKIKREIKNICKILSLRLKNNKSIKSIKDYLYLKGYGFGYENDLIRDKKGNLLRLDYVGDGRVLSEIDNTLPIELVIKTLTKGEFIGISYKSVTLVYGEGEHSPNIFFLFDGKEKKWKLKAILFNYD